MSNCNTFLAFSSFSYNLFINLKGKILKLNRIKHLFYALYLTNSFGFRLKWISNSQEKKKLRLKYSQAQLNALNIEVKVENPEKLPKDGQYLFASNHRTIIDPPIVEVSLKDTNIYGLWISKKELYNSLFFGLFVRNAGSVLLDREKSQMSGFFADIKKGVQEGHSIFIFPEGTRNKTKKALRQFKEGLRLIALKNRLPILPLYIKGNAAEVLNAALDDDSVKREITIVIGDIIDYKEKENIEEVYRRRFSI